MVEYYPLLARAVSAQPNASPDMRNGIYDRARKALLAQLRAHDPPLPEQDIDREAKALESAIARVEAEQTGAAPVSGPTPPVKSEQRPAAPPAKPDAAAPVAASAGAPNPGSVAESTQAKRANVTGSSAALASPKPAAPVGSPGGSAQAVEIASPPRRPALVELRASNREDPVGAAPLIAAPAAIGSQSHAAHAPVLLGETKPDALAPRRPIPKAGILKKFGRSRSAEESAGQDLLREPRSEPDATDANMGSASSRSEDSFEAETETAADAGFRPRPTLPPAPTIASKPKRSPLYWGLGAVVVALIAGVALLAFFLRDAPETVENKKPPTTAEKPASKIIDRVGVGPTRSPPASSAASNSLGSTAAPGASRPAAPARSASALNSPQSPASPAANGASSSAALPVAQRAALLMQSPTASDPQAIATYVGSVVWRLETINHSPGQAPTLAVRAEVDVPEAHFKASMLLEKNMDQNLPASHTIELRFTPGPGSVIGDVKQIDTPQMRREQSPAGDALSGIPTPITENFFLVGLTKGGPAQIHNIDLMKSAGWFDVPMLLANGKIAKITFEKGVAGQKDLNDALASWSE